MAQDMQKRPIDGRADAGLAGTWQVFGFLGFTFVSYFSVGVPVAVLPVYIHMRLGMSAAMAGTVIGLQSLATLASRPCAGFICDRMGAKVSVLWGMAACSASGMLMASAAAFEHMPGLSFALLIASRLPLGMAVSLGSTGAILWGVRSLGQEQTARVISFNGITTYGGVGLGAPFGVVLATHWGLGGIGVFTAAFGAASLLLAARKSPVAPVHGEPERFLRLLGGVAGHGIAVALSTVAYGVLITFIALYFSSRHWSGAALCLTAFGASFIVMRGLFAQAINRLGGYPVAMPSVAITAIAMFWLWRAGSPWMAAAAATLTGLGFSLVYPALGVEAIRHVPEHNRGSALAGYTVFFDVALFLTGPAAGIVIGWYGEASVFLFACVCQIVSLAIVVALNMRKRSREACSG
jgi:predicted MFS family arabinose efflux permease